MLKEGKVKNWLVSSSFIFFFLFLFSPFPTFNIVKYSMLSNIACSVAQLCPTPCDPMDSSLPGSSYPWDFSSKNFGVGCHFLFWGIILTQGSNLHLLYWQADSLPLSHLRSPNIVVGVVYYNYQYLFNSMKNIFSR